MSDFRMRVNQSSNQANSLSEMQENGSKRMRNADKTRIIQRLRRTIDELNALCDEHFMLTISSQDTQKHLSYYGSRRLVKSGFESNLQALLKESKTDLKDPTYMPFYENDKNSDEKCNDSVLYARVLHLLDLFNFPTREHFSLKSRVKEASTPRPKPLYWPSDIKYVSLACNAMGNIVEYGREYLFPSRRDIILHVLSHIRHHYSSCVSSLLEKKEIRDEEPNISRVANYETVVTEDLADDLQCDIPPREKKARLESAVRFETTSTSNYEEQDNATEILPENDTNVVFIDADEYIIQNEGVDEIVATNDAVVYEEEGQSYIGNGETYVDGVGSINEYEETEVLEEPQGTSSIEYRNHPQRLQQYNCTTQKFRLLNTTIENGPGGRRVIQKYVVDIPHHI